MQFFAPRNTYAQGERPYDIFKNRITAIKSIVEQVKTKIADKYWEQLNKTYISELHKKISKDEEIKRLDIYKSDPPENIYPQNTEEIAGQFVDYSVGKMMAKEIMMGRLSAPGTQTGVPSGVIPTGTLPGVTQTPPGTAPSSEVMIPQMDKQELLDYTMSGGKMDWSNILKVMEGRPSFLGGGYSDLESTALQGAMGKDVMGELETGVERAGVISEYFKKPEKKRITNMYEFATEDWEGYRDFLQLQNEMKITTTEQNTQMWIGMYNRKEISRDELMKLLGGYVTPEKLSDFEKKWNMFIKVYKDNNMEIPLDNALKILGAYVTPERPSKTKDLTSASFNTYNKIFYGGDDEWGAITSDEYAEAVKNWEDMNIDKAPPEHLDIVEKALQYCLGVDNKIISRDENNKQTDEWFKLYEWIYPHYKEALKDASPKYLPPEEIKKVGGWEGAFSGDVARGDYGSALMGEGKEKDEKGYIVGETYKDEENVLWKYLGDGKFEEVEKEKTQKRTR